jgi:L-cystine uptake protein TcyP (sodium:dicarboxylate symporter family)
MAATTGNAPKNITWIICLVLYLVALASRFGVIHVGGDIATWSWIIGFGLLLVAVKVKGL